MSLIKSPANGVVIKRKISDGLKEIVSLKENILLETTEKIQSIEVKREEKFIQGYYDGYTKGIIDVMDNFIPLISLLSSELEKNRINMINDLKSILLKSSEEVDVFIRNVDVVKKVFIHKAVVAVLVFYIKLAVFIKVKCCNF